MARDLNDVKVIGRLGRDLELKQTSTGKNYVLFSVANNQDFKDTKRTFWIDCKAWDPIASLMAKYMSKGSSALFEGQLVPEEWEQNGEKHKRQVFLVTNVQFLSKGSGSDSQNASGGTFTPSVEQEYEEYGEYDPSEEF